MNHVTWFILNDDHDYKTAVSNWMDVLIKDEQTEDKKRVNPIFD